MASPKLFAVLAKIETTQFTDPTPTGSSNAMLVTNLTPKPVAIQSVSRDLQRAYLGNSEEIVVQVDSMIEFDIEIAGSGAAGTAPKWGPLLRACAFAETIVASTSVAYNPISTAMESLYIYAYDGDTLLYKFAGARGNMSWQFNAKGIPHMHFTFTGKYVTPTDASIPSTTLSAWITPVACIPANTGTVTIGGYAAKVAQFSGDMANEVDHAIWVNAESLDINDRKPKGSITYELVSLATHNYITGILAATLQALLYTHGVVAGNIVTFAAPKAQLKNFNRTVFNNTLAIQSDLTLNPNSGNDELVITCT